jgi:hypothetical protein
MINGRVPQGTIDNSPVATAGCKFIKIMELQRNDGIQSSLQDSIIDCSSLPRNACGAIINRRSRDSQRSFVPILSALI